MVFIQLLYMKHYILVASFYIETNKHQKKSVDIAIFYINFVS